MSILAISMIRRDGGTQMRVCLNEEAVESYAERMEAGDVFPPVTVFYDGKAHWLADGFHRLAARERLSIKEKSWATAEVDLLSGTRHDAIAFAIGANRANGLRRTNRDKQLAVRAALTHPDLKDKSDQVIANAAGVSRRMVCDARASLSPQVGNLPTSQPNSTKHKAIDTATDRWAKTIGTDGKKYPARKAVPPKKPERSTGIEREQHRVEVAEQGAGAITKHKHVCPTCNGDGYIYE